MSHVLLVGHYGAGNTGDEAALSGTAAALRQVLPGAVLTALSARPGHTLAQHDVDRAVGLADRGAILAELAGCDAVVLGGGGPLFDYGGLEPSLLLAEPASWPLYYLVPGIAAALGKPVVMLGQGVGPLLGEAGRRTIGALARSMTALAVRDGSSRDLLLSLAVDPSRVRVTGDMALLSPALDVEAAVQDRRGDYAVISVRRAVTADTEWDPGAVAEAVDHLAEQHGLRSTFVPFQVAEVDDRELSLDVLARVALSAAGGLLDLGDDEAIGDTMRVVAGARLVVGMRLHSVVFALAAGVPVVALSYDPKVRAVMDEVGLGSWCIDVDALSSAALVAAIDGILLDRQASAAAARAAGQRLRAAAFANLDVLREVLDPLVAPVPRTQFVHAVSGDVARVREEASVRAAQLAAAATELLEVRNESARAVAHERAAAAAAAAHARSELRDSEERVAQEAARAERAEREVERLAAQLGRSTDLLRREETTVAKPLLRRAYRVVRRAGAALPPSTQEKLRARVAPVASLVAPRSPQAAAYQQAQRAIGGRTRAAAPPPVGVDAGRRSWAPRLPGGAAGAFDVVLLPVIDWHFRVQRPQHLATHLAQRGHRVVYLTTEFDRLRAGEAPYTMLESPADGVWVARLACPEPLPRIYRDPMTPEQTLALAHGLHALERDLGLRRPVLLAHHPFWEPLLRASSRNLLVYDLIDDHSGFEDTAPWVLDAEARLLQAVDLVTVTSPTLAEKAPGSVLVRNGAEVERFQERPPVVHNGTRPRVGYFGAIAHWFDTALVEHCARQHPEWDFVLIGSTYGADVSGLEGLPNVALLGELPYAELPSHLHGFDVCLIPFHVIPLTEHTNPVKAYEYLAAGKPVVATAMPEVLLMQPYVHVGRNRADFLTALEAAMAETGDEELAARRRAWAAEHNWDQRAGLVERAVEERCPSASVVVLCYNNLALTRACLDSLQERTRYPDWELVLVDNASTDGTREFLREYARGREGVRLVMNDENLGFAGGNNAGLAVASGDVLVMLNNDTVVTDGWLLGLVRHLRDHEDLGLVGPVTNNIGNEAKVQVDYNDLADMPSAALAYTAERFRALLHVKTVAFFCVAMRREVYEKVGGLDEDFGIGFFEDDDYCRRAQAAGYEIAIAEDVFVHHHLSASFDALGAARKQELFEKSKAVYEAKWGQWTPHTYRPGERS